MGRVYHTRLLGTNLFEGLILAAYYSEVRSDVVRIIIKQNLAPLQPDIYKFNYKVLEMMCMNTNDLAVRHHE